jgi:hypothetical protein
MKTLLLGILLIVVIGIAGFLYRNAMSRPTATAPAGTACTLEAKICPDGTSVGRTGPNCAFAPCPAGNVEVPANGIAFAIPPGYEADENAAGADPSMIGAFVKSGSGASPAGTIIIRDFGIPDGGSAAAVMTAHAIHDPSGKPAAQSEFTPKLIGSHTYQSIVLGRFEGTVESAYFLARSADVLEFEVIETGVDNWTDPNLAVDNLPEHQAFLKFLTSLQITDPALQAPAATSTAS